MKALQESRKNFNNIHINIYSKSNIKEEKKDTQPSQETQKIPLPTQKEKIEIETKGSPYFLNKDQLMENHNRNILNYRYGTVCRIVYSEEKLQKKYKYLTYDDLVDIVNIKEPYNRENYKYFIYKNYVNDDVTFSSQFESGNLRMAIRHSPNEYDLILRPETSCQRTYQWFYFLVINDYCLFETNPVLKLNIINLCKNTIILSDKTKILCYYNNAWCRDTFNILYYLNNIPYLMENGYCNQYKKDSEEILNYNYNQQPLRRSQTMNPQNLNSQTQEQSKEKENSLGLKFHTLTFSFDLSKN